MDGWMENVPRMIRFDYCFGLASLSAKVFSIVKRRKKGERESKTKGNCFSLREKSRSFPTSFSRWWVARHALHSSSYYYSKMFPLKLGLWAERGERQPLELQFQNLIQFNKHWNNSSERLHLTTTRNKKEVLFFFKLEMQLAYSA
jgi:hypothetical protein